MKHISLFFLFFILSSSFFVIAQETPSLPIIVQGKVMINDKLAPAGTLVSAKINNEVIKEYTLTEPGNYILTISNQELGEGENINIYVNDIETNHVINLESGKIIDADLNVEIKTGISKLFIIILLILILLIVLIIVVKFKNNKL